MADKECPYTNAEKVRLMPDYMLKDIYDRIGTEPDWLGWLKKKDCLRDECWKYQCDTCVFADEPEEDDDN